VRDPRKGLAFLLGLFMVGLPLFEWAGNREQWENYDLPVYATLNLFILVLSVRICRKLSRNPPEESPQAIDFSGEQSAMISFIAVISLVAFFVFYLSYVDSLLGAVVFAEVYRNGGYKGSGLYTSGCLKVAPLLLALYLLKSKKIGFPAMLCGVAATIASLATGLRIFLFAPVVFFLLRLWTTASLKRLALISTALIIFMASYKIVLNEDARREGGLAVVRHMLNRSCYRYLLHSTPFEISFGHLNEALPVLHMLTPGDESGLKERVIALNPDLSHEMPYIINASGVAVPLPLLLFNAFGAAGLLFLIFPCALLFFLFDKLLRSRDPLSSLFLISVCVAIFGGLAEDINFLRGADIMILLSVILGVPLGIFGKKSRSRLPASPFQ